MLLSNVDERSTYFRDLFISQPCIIIHFRGKGCLERKREERKKGGGGEGEGGKRDSPTAVRQFQGDGAVVRRSV